MVLNLCSTVSGRTSTFVGALWSFLCLLVFFLGYDCPPSMDSHRRPGVGGAACVLSMRVHVFHTTGFGSLCCY